MEIKHIEYIKTFGHLLTQQQIADVTGKSICTINTYCRANGIETTKTFFQPLGFVVPPLDAADEDNPFKKKNGHYPYLPASVIQAPIVRPPAVYDNPSHEDILNKYLKMKI